MEQNLEFKICDKLSDEREEYFRLLELGFPERNTPDKIQQRLKIYPLDFIFLYDNKKMIGAVALINLSKNIFGIDFTVIHPDYIRREFGSKLMKKVHEEYKGIFLLVTRDAKEFYEKLGYKTFRESDTHTFMMYCNSNKFF